MTLLEVIQKSTSFLDHKGVESPRLSVELLLAHVLEMPRLKLYLEFEKVLTTDQVQTLRELVLQRGRRIPLQHLLGNSSFCGHDIIVNREVLVPRPETEQLADRAITFLAMQPTESGATLMAMDIGTGSGCIPITLALAVPDLRMDAVDLSVTALAVARQNIEHHALSDRITLHQGDCFDPVPAGRHYALILSNPPYIPTGDIETLQPEVRDHDPHSALDGGPDGLDFYRRLATETIPWLAPGGKLMLEIGDGQEAEIRKILIQNGWQVEEVQKDDNGIPRICIACRATT